MDLVARDLAVLWHPCSQMRDYDAFPPLPIAAARGTRLILDDGRSVLDAIGSWWCKSLGHGHPRLLAALAAQAARYEHVILANTAQEPAVALAERLLGLAGPAYGKVFYADNGSTGVEVALKLALQVQHLRGAGRTGFATLSGAYHGETAGAMSVSDCALYKERYGALLRDALVLGPLPLRDGPRDTAWQDADAAWPAIAAQLAPQAKTLAAIIVEPVLQGAGGMRLYSPDLLRHLRAWCDAHGVLLIADEIASGCFRTGTFLAQDHAGVRADLTVVAKGLTGGVLPLCAVLCPDAFYAACLGDWDDGVAFLHSNTYAGNALACAVALAALDEYGETHIAERIAAARLPERLAAATAGRACFAPARGLGMVAAVDLRDRDGRPHPPARRTGYRAFQAAVARGVLLRPLGDTLYLFPPFTATSDELDTMVETLVAVGAAVA